MSFLHLLCKGKGKIPVCAVCDLASHGRGVRPGTDLYIQTKPKPDCCESHLLQNKTLIRLWAPHVAIHPTSPQDVTAGRAWTHTEISGTACHWPDTGQVNADSLRNAFQMLYRQTEMVGCCSWQNFSLGKINSLDCRSESHLPANLPLVCYTHTFSSRKRKSLLLLIASMRLSGLLCSC